MTRQQPEAALTSSDGTLTVEIHVDTSGFGRAFALAASAMHGAAIRSAIEAEQRDVATRAMGAWVDSWRQVTALIASVPAELDHLRWLVRHNSQEAPQRSQMHAAYRAKTRRRNRRRNRRR